MRLRARPPVLSLLLVVLYCCPTHAQPQGPPNQNGLTSALEALLGEVGVEVDRLPPPAEASQDIHLRWDAPALATDTVRAFPPPGGRPEIVSQTARPIPPPRSRTIRLASDRLFIAAVDAQAMLRSWVVVPDPRIVRAEFPGPDGVLEGQTVYRADADLFLTIPDDPSVVELRVYQPVWDGRAFHLVPLETVGLQ